jgi:hypothetical protein
LRVCDGENSQNGFGSFLMDFVSELSEGLSSLLISFVLICLACGWTLVESEGDARKTNAVATMLQDPRKLFKCALRIPPHPPPPTRPRRRGAF